MRGKKRNSSTLSLSMYICTFSSVDRVHFDPLVKLKWLVCSKVTPRGVPRHFYGGPACLSSSFLLLVFRNGARKWEHLSYLCGGVDDKVPARHGTPPFYFARCRQSLVVSSARKAAPFAEFGGESFRKRNFFRVSAFVEARLRSSLNPVAFGYRRVNICRSKVFGLGTVPRWATPLGFLRLIVSRSLSREIIQGYMISSVYWQFFSGGRRCDIWGLFYQLWG